MLGDTLVSTWRWAYRYRSYANELYAQVVQALDKYVALDMAVSAERYT